MAWKRARISLTCGKLSARIRFVPSVVGQGTVEPRRVATMAMESVSQKA